MISPQIRVLVVDSYAVVGGGLHFFLTDAVALWMSVAVRFGAVTVSR